MSQRSRLQSQNPGVFSPTVSRGTDEKSNSTELKSKNDLSSNGVFSPNYYVYDLDSEGIKSSNQVPLDFSKFENHTFFHSAVANVNEAFDKIVNFYPMNGTNKEIEKLAERISHLVLEGILQGQEIITEEDEEQELLAELAALMTQLDFNLKVEDYNKCEELKTKIIKIENKLNKFK